MTTEPRKNAFALVDDGREIGLIEFMPGGSSEIFATSTHVLPEFEGQGLAGQLLDAMADYARENDLKIVPICPYVIHAFKKYPDKYGDVAKM